MVNRVGLYTKRACVIVLPEYFISCFECVVSFGSFAATLARGLHGSFVTLCSLLRFSFESCRKPPPGRRQPCRGWLRFC